MKRVWLLFVIAILIICSPLSYAYQPEIKALNGRDYAPAIKQLLADSQKSIYIYMYVMSYFPGDDESPVNQLVDALIEAKNRGVEVNVVLELSPPVTEVGAVRNDRVYHHLKQAGVNVRYDTTGITLHSKVVIIDQKIVVIGSHNWTKGSLLHNYETSVVIDSPELAKELIAELSRIPLREEEAKASIDISSTAVPKWALLNPQVLTEMVAQNDKRSFDLYLYLLRKWQAAGNQTIDLSFDEVAEVLGMTDRSKRDYRKQLMKKLRQLQDDYRLISFSYERGGDGRVDLLDLSKDGKLLNLNETECFYVPDEYWDYGWCRILSNKAKYAYLIILLEDSERDNPDGYMDLAVRWLGEKYQTNYGSLPGALRELRLYDLVEVKHGPVYPPEARIPNRYKLLKLYSQEDFQKKLSGLEARYGKERVEQARGYLEVIFEENDLDKIRIFAEYLKAYDPEVVEYAVNKVSKMATNNPKRSFNYVIGIIQGEIEIL